MEGIEYLSSPEPELPDEVSIILNDIDLSTPDNRAIIDPLTVNNNEIRKKLPGFESETPESSGKIAELVQYPKTLLSMINAANPDSIISEFHASEAAPSEQEIEPSLENEIRQSEQGSEFSPKETSRGKGKKKITTPSLWKRNIKKKLRQSGQEYHNAKGQKCRKRKIQVSPSCNITCSHDCYIKFLDEDRERIFNAFWTLNDTEKGQFYSKFVKRLLPKRKRIEKTVSRKKYTFKYFFEKENHLFDVCKKFFLSTLVISQQRIYYFFSTKYNETGTHSAPKHGKFIKKVTAEEDLIIVKEHIKSFPVMDSHYCRTNTKKQYLEAGLSLTKMHKMYVEKVKKPVGYFIYRKVFNESFNLSFFKPKIDICDKCAKFKATKNPNATETRDYNAHRSYHNEAKVERDIDRKNDHEDTAVIVYDLENVFSLPKANVSSYYYRRKYAVYNLTGFCQNNKVTYCGIWHESLSGRSGNDIASCLIVILKKVLSDLPKTRKMILWSDACIPQNKNRMVSLAILKFMEANKNIETITHKYSEPGHSQVQEVDAVHSGIEKYLKDLEVYSPVSLIRILSGMNYSKIKLKITQLRKEDFLNFNKASLDLNMIPFKECRQIKYKNSDLLCMYFKKQHTEDFKKSKITRSARGDKLPKVEQSNFNIKLTKEKKKDIQAMLPYMPNIQDRRFYENIIRKH